MPPVSFNFLFRFHTGSIKRWNVDRILELSIDRFDSILVRLKVNNKVLFVNEEGMFRFHTGSIKSHGERASRVRRLQFRFHTGSIKRIHLDMEVSLPLGFDSILVRLKVAANPYRHSTLRRVSIPYWFD